MKAVFGTRQGVIPPKDMKLETAAWALANTNRFNGHLDNQVSVLAHSLHCSHIASIAFPLNYELQMYMLFHDIPEAYTGDIVTYLKRELFNPATLAKLHRLEDDILKGYGIDLDIRATHTAAIKAIDHDALTLEADYGFENFNPEEWPECMFYDELDLIEQYAPMSPEEQVEYFLDVENLLRLKLNISQPLAA